MESNAQPNNKIDGLETQSFRYLQFKSDLAKFHEKSFKKVIKLLEKEEWVLGKLKLKRRYECLYECEHENSCL